MGLQADGFVWSTYLPLLQCVYVTGSIHLEKACDKHGRAHRRGAGPTGQEQVALVSNADEITETMKQNTGRRVT